VSSQKKGAFTDYPIAHISHRQNLKNCFESFGFSLHFFSKTKSQSLCFFLDSHAQICTLFRFMPLFCKQYLSFYTYFIAFYQKTQSYHPQESLCLLSVVRRLQKMPLTKRGNHAIMILLPKEMIGIFLQYGQMFLQTTVNG
jgi:hypothetical protein